jgi:hypothetical protein
MRRKSVRNIPLASAVNLRPGTREQALVTGRVAAMAKIGQGKAHGGRSVARPGKVKAEGAIRLAEIARGAYGTRHPLAVMPWGLVSGDRAASTCAH